LHNKTKENKTKIVQEVFKIISKVKIIIDEFFPWERQLKLMTMLWKETILEKILFIF
jgi:hypothetical protein